MSLESLEAISIVLANLGLSVAAAVAAKVTYSLFRKQHPKPLYSKRLSELAVNLKKSSSEMDSVIQELTKVAADRETAVKNLERDLKQLEGREGDLKKKIEDLEKVPLPVAKHFAELMERGERKNALRDYMLFGAGVVVSIISAIVLKMLGIA